MNRLLGSDYDAAPQRGHAGKHRGNFRNACTGVVVRRDGLRIEVKHRDVTVRCDVAGCIREVRRFDSDNGALQFAHG